MKYFCCKRDSYFFGGRREILTWLISQQELNGCWKITTFNQNQKVKTSFHGLKAFCMFSSVGLFTTKTIMATANIPFTRVSPSISKKDHKHEEDTFLELSFHRRILDPKWTQKWIIQTQNNPKTVRKSLWHRCCSMRALKVPLWCVACRVEISSGIVMHPS